MYTKIEEHIIEKDKKYIWHPYTQQTTDNYSIEIVSAKDALLIGNNNQTYIDAISSWWVTLHGHGNTAIAKSIYKQACQLEQIIFANFTHAPAVTLAEKLLSILPSNMSKVFYSDNGSTAVEVALKMAIQFWDNQGNHQRNKIIAFKNSYHGDTFGAMSVSNRGVFTLPFHNRLFDVVFIDIPTEHTLPHIIHAIKELASSAICVIYEPLVQAAGGMILYEEQYLDSFLKVVKQEQIVCIADEVMTGFGRTGKLFAHDYLSISPDIICLSKCITGGFLPFAATICSASIHAAFIHEDASKTLFHGHSYTGNPLGCAASLANINLLQQKKTLQKISWLTEQNKQMVPRLQSIQSVLQARCRGTILAFEIADDQHNYLNKIGKTITKKGLEKGIFIRPLGNTVYILPPYSITPAQLEQVYDFLLEIAHFFVSYTRK